LNVRINEASKPRYAIGVIGVVFILSFSRVTSRRIAWESLLDYGCVFKIGARAACDVGFKSGLTELG
jgi:hypothetical protein